MNYLPKTVRKVRGFTLIELLVVITIIGIFAIAAIPNFISGYRKATFSSTVAEVATLFERARTQALASELDVNQKIPPGGYGVWLGQDPVDNIDKAILFINDWNATVGGSGAKVNMDYADTSFSSRVVPDEVYTPGSDTILAEVPISDKPYIDFQSLKTLTTATDSWGAAPDRLMTGVTTIFYPPFAETKIDGVVSQQLQATFVIRGTTVKRILTLDRITTAPRITK